MTESGQSNTHNKYFEAAQKFDYFVTGGAGTALTYAVQTYQPVPLEVFHQLVPFPGCRCSPRLEVGSGISRCESTTRESRWLT
jgi:hypothetical protein